MPVVIQFFFKDDGPFLARLIEPDFEPRCITADTGQSAPLPKQYQCFGKIECVAHGVPSRIIFSGRVRARGKGKNLGNDSRRYVYVSDTSNTLSQVNEKFQQKNTESAVLASKLVCDFRPSQSTPFFWRKIIVAFLIKIFFHAIKNQLFSICRYFSEVHQQAALSYIFGCI